MKPIEILSGDPFGWHPRERPSTVAIGVFDGVHLGHQDVLRRLTEHARQISGDAVALTFDPHPLEIIDPKRAPKLLTTIEERAQVMASCGVDVMGVLPFVQIRDLEPQLFMSEILTLRLHAAWIAVGEDFRFGRDRAGDPELLRLFGRRLGFEVDVVSMIGDDERDVISSTRIRALLSDGQVAAVERLLGRRFHLQGTVVHGDARGRVIGFPTANLRIPERMAVPGDGVYAAFARSGGEVHLAVVNIGVRPTFGVSSRTVEVHLLDFDEDIYGSEVRVEFVERIRAEQKFPSLDELIAQIGTDAETAREVLEAEARA